MKKSVLLLTTFVFMVSSVLMAQTLTVKTYGVSPRNVEEDNTVGHYFDVPSNGLTNVGKEVKVYLQGTKSTALVSPQWTFVSKPFGSQVTFGSTLNIDTSNQLITFRPDVVGTYTIQFADGGLTATIVINSALYTGVKEGGCKACHGVFPQDNQGIYDKWANTGHATMLVRGLNGTLSNHYSEACIKCHTTGYIPDANNNGFDDFPFVFPTELKAGMYDSMAFVYPDAMKRANIQCESCHGPASEHYGDVTNNKIAVSLDVKNCAYCHDEGTHHGFPTAWEYSGEDASEFDGRGFEGGHAIGAYVGYAGGRAGCSPCHSGAGYIQWIREGRPVNAAGLPAATTVLPPATNISCAVCNDPHDATNLHQLRALTTNLADGTPVTFDKYGTGAQCMDCHRARVYAYTYASNPANGNAHYGGHHGPQADMLLGKNAPDFGMNFPSSPHGVAGGNSCNDCHMAGTLADAQGNINKVGGHTWNMNDAEGNDFVQACNNCHGNVGTSFKDKKYYVNGNADLDGNGVAEGLQVEVKGMLEELAALLPHDANGNVLIMNTNVEGIVLTPNIMKAGYVYFFVEEDRSLGLHNPAYTVSLLKAAIEIMGGTTSIDYPSDGLPVDYQISQNYPNPFNPSTTINFNLPTDSKVKIAVYNLAGELVKVLVDGEYSAGSHETQFNTNSVSGLASGIYFYQINAVSNDGKANFTQTKKMVLMK